MFAGPLELIAVLDDAASFAVDFIMSLTLATTMLLITPSQHILLVQ
jgi:hypothetical protein